ncbi:MAG: sugar ABC transporter permease, partial [Pseudomonadota bacterium]
MTAATQAPAPTPALGVRRFSRRAVFYLFALPFAALTIVFGLWPIVLSIEVSLTQSATALRPEPTYVGLENYVEIL